MLFLMRQFNATKFFFAFSKSILNLKNSFSRITFASLKSILNLEHFQKNMTGIADVFPKLPTLKNVVR